jgi:DNA polymerase III subunit beta
MKLTCKKELLQRAFQIVNYSIPAKSTMPLLQHIKLTANKDTLWVMGTDLETGIQYQLEATVKEPGGILLPAIRFGNILREITIDDITIETDGNVANIKTRDSHFRLVGQDPAEYPDFPKFDFSKAVTLEASGIKEMIRKTIFATSLESSRYALTGLLLELKKKEIRLVGSDGKRLAYCKKKTDQAQAQENRVIVPPKGMTLIEKITEGPDVKNIQLVIEETQIKFGVQPNIFAFSRLIEGSFPDYEKIIPADCDKKIELKTGEFHSALRRVSLVTTDKFRATKLTFKNNKLSMFSRTQDVGEAEVEMPIKYTQDPFEIVFNPEFFIDALRTLNEDEDMVIELKNKTSPAVLKMGRDYVYLVMPLSVDI